MPLPLRRGHRQASPGEQDREQAPSTLSVQSESPASLPGGRFRSCPCGASQRCWGPDSSMGTVSEVTGVSWAL